jgi:hypothetical protein
MQHMLPALRSARPDANPQVQRRRHWKMKFRTLDRFFLPSATTGEIYHRDLVRGHVQSVDTVARGPRDSHDTSLYSTQPMLSHSIDTKRFSLSGLPPGTLLSQKEKQVAMSFGIY